MISTTQHLKEALPAFDDAISNGKIVPVILFGNPGSGTQMFRGMISGHEEVTTWPYNEMTTTHEPVVVIVGSVIAYSDSIGARK